MKRLKIDKVLHLVVSFVITAVLAMFVKHFEPNVPNLNCAAFAYQRSNAVSRRCLLDIYRVQRDLRLVSDPHLRLRQQLRLGIVHESS